MKENFEKLKEITQGIFYWGKHKNIFSHKMATLSKTYSYITILYEYYKQESFKYRNKYISLIQFGNFYSVK